MLETTNTTKQSPLVRKEDFVSIKERILGKKYDLSLVFIGDTRARRLNFQSRKKTYIPNILSFPLDKESGEIFINLKKAKQESKQSDLSPENYIKFLFIHGCLHLKGLKHGDVMESEEDKYTKKFCV